MEDDEIRRAINSLEQQEITLLEALKKIDDQIVRVRSARAALIALREQEPLPFDGNLASAVRVVLFNNQKKSFKPIEVRDAVKAIGFGFREEQNQMAAVHGVLKRLAESNEVLTKEWSKQPGISRYYWNPEAPPPQAKLIPLSSLSRPTPALTGLLAALYTPQQLSGETPLPMKVEDALNLGKPKK